MHKEVFRENEAGELELVGDFDALYRNDVDPWDQGAATGERAAYYAGSRMRLAAMINRLELDRLTGLEIGCGHGHSVAVLHLACGGRWSGADISFEAIKRARELVRPVNFFPVDITRAWPFLGSERGRYDVVVLSECLWYVMHEWRTVVSNLAGLVKPGGVAIISQAFLRGKQRYGAEIADGFHGAMELTSFAPEFTSVHGTLCQDLPCFDHGLIFMRRNSDNQ